MPAVIMGADKGKAAASCRARVRYVLANFMHAILYCIKMLKELLCSKVSHLTELADDVRSSFEAVAVALTLCRSEETGYG
jgi:hypothetical protein